MIRLLLIDDSTLLRQTLALALSRRRGLEVAVEAASAAVAKKAIRSQNFDVAIVEPLIENGGVSLLGDLCNSERVRSTLVITASATELSALQAFRAGVRGFLTKKCEIADVEAAIHRVHEGEVVIAPSIANAVFSGAAPLGSSEGHGLAGLTSREVEVVRLVTAGLTNPEIAQTLCITEHTTKGHLAKILRKLELSNRVQLAALAMQQGITGSEIDSGVVQA